MLKRIIEINFEMLSMQGEEGEARIKGGGDKICGGEGERGAIAIIFV